MKKKLPLILIIVLLIAAIKYFNLTNYLNLNYVKSNLDSFKDYYALNPIQTISIFTALYILVTALSIPGATILTLTAGALFGLLKGLIIVSFASSIGATLAFLASRYLLRDSLQKKYGEKLNTINEGINKDGASYLFSLRLLPIFPFFLINLLMGLTPIKTSLFYLISQIGMLPGTAIYINAGSQLSQIENLKGIMSPRLILSFVLLGIFPFIVKFIFKSLRGHKNNEV